MFFRNPGFQFLDFEPRPNSYPRHHVFLRMLRRPALWQDQKRVPAELDAFDRFERPVRPSR